MSGVPDPQFTCKISQAESNPEGDAKKVKWGKTGQRTRSKKYPHHRSHRRHAERNRHGANYPFAMQRDLTATNDLMVSLDVPSNNSTVTSAFQITGWAIDRARASGSGVNAIDVYVIPAGGAPMGRTTHQASRPSADS